jgi:hypothetical protein
MWMKIPPFNSVINLKAYERVVGLWNFVVKGSGILSRLRIIKADRYGHIIYFGGSYIFGSVHAMWMKIPPFNSVNQFLWMVLVKCQHEHYSDLRSLEVYRPFAASRYRSLSFHPSWNWNIFTGTNTFEHAEFKSEKFPLRKPACSFLTNCNFIVTNFTTTFFIVQRHGSMTTNDYVTQIDQFLLTSLPFNKRPVLLESFWVMLYYACWT